MTEVAAGRHLGYVPSKLGFSSAADASRANTGLQADHKLVSRSREGVLLQWKDSCY